MGWVLALIAGCVAGLGWLFRSCITPPGEVVRLSPEVEDIFRRIERKGREHAEDIRELGK